VRRDLGANEPVDDPEAALVEEIEVFGGANAPPTPAPPTSISGREAAAAAVNARGWPRKDERLLSHTRA